MTRKDYEKIAKVIVYNRNQMGLPDRNESATDSAIRTGYTVALNDVTYMLCDMLAQDNPRFDRARFLKACGRED